MPTRIAAILVVLFSVSAQAAALDAELRVAGDAETGDSSSWAMATAEVAIRALLEASPLSAAEEIGAFTFLGGAPQGDA